MILRGYCRLPSFYARLDFDPEDVAVVEVTIAARLGDHDLGGGSGAACVSHKAQ